MKRNELGMKCRVALIVIAKCYSLHETVLKKATPGNLPASLFHIPQD